MKKILIYKCLFAVVLFGMAILMSGCGDGY